MGDLIDLQKRIAAKRPEELTFEELTAHLPPPEPGTLLCAGHRCLHFAPNQEAEGFDWEAFEEGELDDEGASSPWECKHPDITSLDPNCPPRTGCPLYTPKPKEETP